MAIDRLGQYLTKVLGGEPLDREINVRRLEN